MKSKLIPHTQNRGKIDTSPRVIVVQRFSLASNEGRNNCCVCTLVFLLLKGWTSTMHSIMELTLPY